MSDPLYSVLFGLVSAVTLAIGIGSNILRARAARRSFTEGNARIEVNFGAMRRLARVRHRHLFVLVLANGVALLFVVSSSINDISALVVIPPLFGSFAAAVFPGNRADRLRRAMPDGGRKALSDGTRVFLVQGNRVIAWIGASPSALADAGVFPSARVQTPSGPLGL